MSADPGHRHVLLGLAPARAGWLPALSRLATSGAAPVEFVPCVSAAELRARLRSGRNWSAVLVDATHPGLDRDLIAVAAGAGAVVLVVGAPAGRDWTAAGAAATLAEGFGRDELLEALRRHAAAVRRVEPVGPGLEVPADGAADRGTVVAVTGDPGAGTSTVAMALAQGLVGARPGPVLLADLCLRADQAVLHGVGDVLPGVPELVEAHRGGSPSAEAVRALAFDVPERGYQLLLGLRRHRDWAALRPRAFLAGLASLQATYGVVVCDVDPDLEGERETGSAEVEERNLMSRSAVGRADVVVVVGSPTLKGVHGLLRATHDVLAHGVEPERVVPVVTRAPRGPRSQAEITAAVTHLLGQPTLGALVLVTEQRRVEAAVRDRQALPGGLVDPLRAVVRSVLDAHRARPAFWADPAPEPVAPGSLGRWSDVG